MGKENYARCSKRIGPHGRAEGEAMIRYVDKTWFRDYLSVDSETPDGVTIMAIQDEQELDQGKTYDVDGALRVGPLALDRDAVAALIGQLSEWLRRTHYEGKR